LAFCWHEFKMESETSFSFQYLKTEAGFGISYG